MQTENAIASRLSARKRFAVAIGVIYAVAMLNFWIPTFRFVSPAANSLTFAAFQLIPVVLLALSLFKGTVGERVVKFLLLTPIAAFATLAGSCSVIHGMEMVESGQDPSFERIHSVPLGVSRVVAYRTNGGATTSFGIVVRQECEILPGLVRIRQLWRAYPAYEVEIVQISRNRIRLSAPLYGNRWPQPSEGEVELGTQWCPAAG